jgi:hypothetical protein
VGEGEPEQPVSDPDWSRHCGDLWRDNVLAATGRDVCKIVGPSPRRARDWVRTMRILGVRDLHGVVCAVHGPPIARREVRRGDIVRKGWALGVCRGELSEFFGGAMVPIGAIDAAWRVTEWRGNG